MSKTSSKTTICFTGDLYLKSREELSSAIDKSVKDYLNSGDACFINYESPVTGYRKSFTSYVPRPRRDRNYSPEDTLNDFPSLYPNGVISLANDHIGDRGSVGIIDTLETFEKNNIPFIGAGRYPEEELSYKIVGDNVKVGVVSVIGRKYGIKKFANKIGPLRIRRRSDDVAQLIKELREKVDYVVLIYHGGRRYNSVAEPRKRGAFKRYMDMGCDVVVAHHPHSVQQPEMFNGKFAFYSLGDLFLSERAEVTGRPMEGIILKLEFTDKGIKPEICNLNIENDKVSLADKVTEIEYIDGDNDYKAKWDATEEERRQNRQAYRDYNRTWKRAAYVDERDNIARTLELIDKNREAADLEGIEERLKNRLEVLIRRIQYIDDHTDQSSEDYDIELQEEIAEEAEKNAKADVL